jgi:integrase
MLTDVAPPPRFPINSVETFLQVLELHLSRASLRTTTRDTYRKKAAHFLRFLGGDVKIVEITEIIAGQYRDFVLATCQASTFNIARRHLNVVFNVAVREKLISQSPFLHISPAQVPKKPPKRIAMDDLETALQVLERSEGLSFLKHTWFWLTVIRTLYLTGMRINQLLYLTWADINFKELTICLRAETSKNKREWMIPLPVKLYKPLLEIRRRAMGISGNAVTDDASVFNYSLYCGKKRVWGLTYWQVAKFCKDLKRETGIKISSHRVRHTTASEMMKRTSNPKVVQQQLGHTNLATTMIYVHVDLGDARSLVDQL